jgi:hypothetical protein
MKTPTPIRSKNVRQPTFKQLKKIALLNSFRDFKKFNKLIDMISTSVGEEMNIRSMPLSSRLNNPFHFRQVRHQLCIALSTKSAGNLCYVTPAVATAAQPRHQFSHVIGFRLRMPGGALRQRLPVCGGGYVLVQEDGGC